MFMILSMLTAVATASPQAAPANAKDKDPIICETSAATEVGTHMKAKRTCLHKSQWEFVHDDLKRELQKLRDNGALPKPESSR